ncbi:disulfide bond formation protein B [Shewanella sp. NFH-SH190041]|uniref:disulfide bond formation protein DsbB n=1 Tax=Shewanella sp. NFH-SH190041 TaxID=2950245 RepID=UPI0021C3AA59|nr:disulfide bond formation protein DsbB [Shewanella sp. NFH-SH190041]BDM64811.1 disulfide bond formation protein B [Shewanella sp. NFH-SH190041]
MAALIQFAQSRLAWLILGASALLLEACALFFQYGMHLHPCVLCVYQRVAVMGILFAAIIGLISPRGILRFPAALLWLVSAAWGEKLATSLHDMQANPSPFSTCSFLPDFPSFAPLHTWFPDMFMPTGLCGDDVWGMLGLSMAQWMQVAFALYLFAWFVMIVPLCRR